jgi:glycosyl transferase family 87
MNRDRRPILKTAGLLLTLTVLGVLFYLRAIQNYTHQDYTNSNFFFFWLSGRMMWTGENPYDQAQWLAGHAAAGATWIPNKIFPYPLPLAYFMAPLGLLSLGGAFIAWQIFTQILIALTVFALLRHWRGGNQMLLFLPLMILLLFFGPVYLTLQIGSAGALALVAVLLCILLLEKNRPILAGAALALTILKPPQGLTILVLAGIWFLARREWRAILGVALGGIILLVMGLARDPLWLVKFRGASEVVLDRTLGIHSNLYSFTYLACGQSLSCMWVAGSLATLLALGLGGYYLWRSRDRLTPWEAFNLILPLGFVSTIYLWSYDQLTYVIPITWIAGTLVERRRSFVQAFAFLILLDLLAFAALLAQAYTKKDLYSIVTTILVLGTCLWLLHSKRPAAQ